MRSEAPHLPSARTSSQGIGGVNAPIPSSPRTRKIWAPPGGNDIVSRMRNSWLGRLYRNRLKQFLVVRSVARWIWCNPFSLCIRLSLWMVERLPLTKLSDFAKKSGIPTCKLADAELVETPQPKVFPVHDQCFLVAPHDQYTFPEIFVATINNAITYGGTNLILADGEIVCHDLYDFERDSTAEELHGRALIDPKSRQIRLLCRDKAPEPIPVAATFVDACAPNYAHWMTEVLPRVALFCAEQRFNDVPIVVNEGLHHNIMESLFLVAGVDREVILLPIGRALAVNQLYLTSVAGYVPFERRTKKLSDHSHGVFSPRAFEMLREHLGALARKAEKWIWPEKIFLRRTSGIRNVTNAVEIEHLLMDHGYVIVEPETLTFLQQVQYFAHAKVVVGPTGAGFANAIFCEKGTHVAILISKSKDLAYKYWVNMLSPIGVQLSYVLGDIVDNHQYGVHGDFAINTSYLMEFLDYLEHN
jgi:capsular polysaccharide biosynthesis protein